MEFRRHKRNLKNHVFIVTSDAPDARMRQIRVRPWLLWVIITVLCVVVGAAIGYFFNEARIHQFVNRRTEAQQAVIDGLEEDKKVLGEEKALLEQNIQDLKDEIDRMQKETANLNAQIALLSDTVQQKTEAENELLLQLENQKIPTEYPLTGSASLLEEDGSDSMLFNVSEGTTVIATASGTVTAINDDREYGHNVWIDHGNGYITIYRNSGDAIVRLGDTVAYGTTLFVIGSGNTVFCYQIMKDGEYINPWDILSING